MKKIGLLVIPLMTVFLLASCSNPSLPSQYEVTCTDGVTITNKTAIQGEKYETNLTTKNGVILPEKVNKVTINEAESFSYTYSKTSDTLAKFSIEPQYVTGPINIELNYGYQVTATKGVTLAPGTQTATPNAKYDTTLIVSNGTILPTSITRVTIDGKESSSYTYHKTIDNEAEFSIDAQYVTGPINIELNYEYQVTVTEGVNLTPGTQTAIPNEQYDTTLTVADGTILPNNATNVTINRIKFTNYTYNKTSDNEAEFSIDAQYVTGPINIELNYEYQVTVSNGVTLMSGTEGAIPNKIYYTNLTVNSGSVLPIKPRKITINGITFTNYTYRKTSDNEAEFSIDARYVTGPINIELNYEYQVTATEGVNLTPGTQTAIPNEQYDTTLTVADGTILPNSAAKVTINGQEFSNYTYSKTSDTHANFSIDAQYVTGPINVDLGLNYFVTATDGVTLEGGTEIAIRNVDYATTLTVDNGTVLPNSIARVTIDGKESSNYVYSKISHTLAAFSIDAQYVTGPINIELNYEYQVTVSNGVTLAPGTQTAIPNKTYHTTLTVVDQRFALPNNVTKVTVGGAPIANYTYTKYPGQYFEASLAIEAQCVTGPINIDLGLNYFVNVTGGVSLREGTEIAVRDADYATTLTVNDTTLLPNEVTSVKVNGTKLTTGYNYYLESALGTKAYFSIEAQYVTGPIDIDLGLEYICTASCVTIGGEAITLSNTVVKTWEDYETTISFSDETYHDKNLPDAPISVTANGKPVPYTYTPDEIYRNKATLKIEESSLEALSTSDVVITLALPNKTKWYEFSDWWNYCSTQQGSIPIANKDTDVGQIVYAEVYGLMHKVRLIGVDHVNAIGEEPEAHCTFEFANTVTKSLQYIDRFETAWDENDNCNFPNSTLNNLLNKNNDCVFTKLPEGLQNAIKEVGKKVGISNDGGTSYVATSYKTKLFPLAHDEMTSHEGHAVEGEGTIYQYYIDHPDPLDRLKKRLGGLTGLVDIWLRSPYIRRSDGAWRIRGNNGSGDLQEAIINSQYTTSWLVPAFCI